MLSKLIIVPLTFLAISSAKFDFPDAVGPATTIIGASLMFLDREFNAENTINIIIQIYLFCIFKAKKDSSPFLFNNNKVKSLDAFISAKILILTSYTL